MVSNDTPVQSVTLTDGEINKFHSHIQKIERMCGICGKFLDTLVDSTGTTGDKKFHIASYLKQYFNNEIREGREISNVRNALDNLIIFYHEKMKKELAKIKTQANLTKKRRSLYSRVNSSLVSTKESSKLCLLFIKRCRLLRNLL